MCGVCASVFGDLQRPGEGVGSPAAGVKGSTDPLQEKRALKDGAISPFPESVFHCLLLFDPDEFYFH